MKTFTLLMLVAVATVSSVSAQNYNSNQRANDRQQPVIANRNDRDANNRADNRFGNNQRSEERFDSRNSNNNRYDNNRYAINDRRDNNRFERNDRRDDRRYNDDKRYNKRNDCYRVYQVPHRRF